MTEDLLLNAFTIKDCHPSQVRMFPLKSERSSSGLVEFPSVALAVNAIMKCNHSAIEHKGRILRLFKNGDFELGLLGCAARGAFRLLAKILEPASPVWMAVLMN